MLERISTGIPKLDRILGGGLIRGKTYLITGETGVGKTILSLQFLMEGLKNGEHVAYVSLDERVQGVLEGATTLGWDFWSYYKMGVLYPFEIRIFSEDLRKYGKSSRAYIDTIIKMTNGGRVSRIVLDPISAMAFGAMEEFAVREYIREIILFLEEKIGATTVLTCDIPSGSNRLSRFGYEEFLSSGVIVVGLRNVGGRLVRTLMVRKMRWSPADMSVYTFEIMHKRGVVIGPPLRTVEAALQSPPQTPKLAQTEDRRERELGTDSAPDESYFDSFGDIDASPP
ncbi:MAG: ATPase domain-containing protein [Nitrososphaerota archaeon]|nr:ATPase domain-containing protein [Nitrososphaerota archaeon]